MDDQEGPVAVAPESNGRAGERHPDDPENPDRCGRSERAVMSLGSSHWKQSVAKQRESGDEHWLANSEDSDGDCSLAGLKGRGDGEFMRSDEVKQRNSTVTPAQATTTTPRSR